MSKPEQWEIELKPERLTRRWSFEDFKQAWDLVNKISSHAQQVNHHPDICFGWGYLNLSITTHDQGKLTAADYEFAASIDKICSDENL